MATQAAKAQRRAVALSELKRLSALIAETMDTEIPEVKSFYSHDPELSQIMQLESVNQLLQSVVDNVGPSDDAPSLESLTKAELLQKAADAGVQVPKTAKKADLIEAVKSTK